MNNFYNILRRSDDHLVEWWWLEALLMTIVVKNLIFLEFQHQYNNVGWNNSMVISLDGDYLKVHYVKQKHHQNIHPTGVELCCWLLNEIEEKRNSLAYNGWKWIEEEEKNLKSDATINHPGYDYNKVTTTQRTATTTRSWERKSH